MLPRTRFTSPARPHATRRQRARGFSLAELVVTLAVLSLVMIGLLSLFDFTTKVSRAQVQAAELQQSQRVAQQELVRMTRMAGRGGLVGHPPQNQTNGVVFPQQIAMHRSPAIEVVDAVGDAASQTALGWPYTARQGTDVLIVRGVLTTPVYLVNFVQSGNYDDAARTVTISGTTVDGQTQNLQPLLDAIATPGDALLLVSALNDAIYGVAEVVGGAGDATSVTLQFTDSRVLGSSPRTIDYGFLSAGGTFPTLQQVSYVGIVEEYRYYVRDGVRDGRPWPSLNRARVYPQPTFRTSSANPVVAYANNAANLTDEYADGIFDLQLALGYDSTIAGRFLDDANNTGNDDLVFESADGTGDDWLFNAVEATNVAPWIPGGSRLWGTNQTGSVNPQPTLYYARISTLARTERQDLSYTAPLVTRIENNTHSTAANDPLNGTEGRRYRRQLLQTTVDLRNAG